MIKFLHLSDVHLGCRRYNLEERTKDFFRSWYDVIERHAVQNRVDFVLVAGDFFDRRNIDPQTLNHALAGLQRLKDEGIPVVAIEGNHDRRDAVSEYSWMRSLSRAGYIHLLEPGADEDSPISMTPWDEATREGSYIDIKGARIYGSHWYGTSAAAAMSMLADALRRARSEDRFNILMLHTDVEGQLSRPIPALPVEKLKELRALVDYVALGHTHKRFEIENWAFNILMLHTDIEGQLNRPIPALPVEKLKELRALVDYVALGHTHKRFEIENWAFNPGSLEACSIDEYREERGVFLVEVDDRRQVTATFTRDYTQRPFQQLWFDVSGVEDPDAVRAGVIEKVKREARKHDEESGTPAPIIEISLRGHLGFKNSLLDLAAIREEARQLTGALHIMLKNQSVPVEYAVAAGLDADTSRQERERRIVEDLIARDNRFRDRSREMAELVLEAKRRALGDDTPADILELIEQKLAPRPRDERAEPDAAAAPPATALQALERSAEQAVSVNGE